MKKLILGLCLISSIASAAELRDLKLLSVVPGQDKIQLKLKTKDSPEGSYFYVEIMRSDEDSFVKLAQVIKKLAQGDNYRLNLDIKSFSGSPSGSSYRSEGIKFYGTDAQK